MCNGTDSRCRERIKRLYESESRSEKKASGLEVRTLGHRIPVALSRCKDEGPPPLIRQRGRDRVAPAVRRRGFCEAVARECGRCRRQFRNSALGAGGRL